MRRLALTLIAFFSFAPPAHAAWVWPVQGDVITPYRNGTDPYASGQHRGIDIGASAGTPVRAAMAGEVLFAGTAGSSGLTISVRTDDGYDTSYLHLSSLAVRAGAQVGAGDRIGAVGTTGTRSATQPHLHFGVRDAGTRHAYHDPIALLPPPAGPRAPDPTPPATAPEPAPAPPAAAPAPARQPTGAPRGAPRPAPVSRRVTRRGPVGHPAPRPAPVSRRAPRSAPVGHPAPLGAPHPAVGDSRLRERAAGTPAIPDARHAARTTPAAPGAPSPSRALALSSRSSAPGTRALPRHLGANASATPGEASRSAESDGPKLGWALACAALLLAAGVLGLADGGRRSARRRRARGRGSRPVRRPRVASMVHAVLRDHAHLLRQR